MLSKRSTAISFVLLAQIQISYAQENTTTEPSQEKKEIQAPEGQVKNEESTKAKNFEKKPEKIQVTGSRIRRVDVETTAPVVVIDKKAIEQSGVATLGEVFRKSASSSPTGNFQGTSSFVSSGAATIDLLGLGGNRTLVLLNGKRLPAIGGLDAVNIDNIPTSLVERIDILSGGASAVYGADAVGGVVKSSQKSS